jgi:hypothetical protein
MTIAIFGAEYLETLAKLAQLRQVPLLDLMKTLGISIVNSYFGSQVAIAAPFFRTCQRPFSCNT